MNKSILWGCILGAFAAIVSIALGFGAANWQFWLILALQVASYNIGKMVVASEMKNVLKGIDASL